MLSVSKEYVFAKQQDYIARRLDPRRLSERRMLTDSGHHAISEYTGQPLLRELADFKVSSTVRKEALSTPKVVDDTDNLRFLRGSLNAFPMT